MEDLLDLKLDSLLEELGEEFEGKILKLEVEDRIIENNTVKYLTLYIKDVETDFIRRISLKVSKRKNSKFGVFLEHLKKAGFNMTLKDLSGCVFKFKEKNIKIGNFDVTMFLPVQYLSKEPITKEEEELLNEYLNRNNNDEILTL